MLLKAVNWNIGGGLIRDKTADPLADSYKSLDLDYVAEVLAKYQADIITLQEVQADEKHNQVETLAGMLNLPHTTSDFFSESHLSPGSRLGQGIISAHPLQGHKYKLLPNQRFEVVRHGQKILSHDKGVTTAMVTLGGVELVVKTMHLIPFEPFKIDPFSDQAAPIFKALEAELQDPSSHLLIQGDLNLGVRKPLVRELMPNLIDNQTLEANLPSATMANQEKPDRVIYRGLKLVDVKVDSQILTDHYPIICTFEIS